MSKIVVYLIEPEKYFQQIVEIIKKNIAKKMVIYVTASRPYSQISESLSKAGVNPEKLFFIDCVSKKMGEHVEDSKPCVFLDSQQSLTSLSIAINEAIKSDESEKILIMDSISTLLLYNDDATMSRFANFIMNRARYFNVDAYLLALASDKNSSTIGMIESLADEVKRDGN